MARETPPGENLPRPSVPRAVDPPTQLFIGRASAVDKRGFKVTSEALHPVGRDGRTLEFGDKMRRAGVTLDSAFVDAAFKLAHRGDLSDFVRTPFGFHVIMLVDRLPASIWPLEARRERFASRIIHERTERALAALVERLRQTTPTDDDAANVDALLEQVKVAP
jgi:hypothetical protein